MHSATIKLFLPYGDPKRLRTAELSNWSGKAIAAPRTDFELLLEREEISHAGVYLLLGNDTDTGRPSAYVGEAESLGRRLKDHREKEFWNQVVVFLSKDENLTKSHVKFLEGMLIEKARVAARVHVLNEQQSGAKLPESERADMVVFQSRIEQLLPVLGSDLLVPVLGSSVLDGGGEVLLCELKGLVAKGRRSPGGFVVLKGSKAAREVRPSAPERHRWVITLRESLIQDGTLRALKDSYVFTRDVEFSSPSAAAGVVHGGGSNGMTSWRDEKGHTLKELETHRG